MASAHAFTSMSEGFVLTKRVIENFWQPAVIVGNVVKTGAFPFHNRMWDEDVVGVAEDVTFLGIATVQNLLVASSVRGRIHVFRLCAGDTRAFRAIHVFERHTPPRFAFNAKYGLSGYLAFLGGDIHRVVVSDHGNEAVHVVDPVLGKCVGFVAAPLTIKGPRNVASSSTGDAVAVSLWNYKQPHGVQIYRSTSPCTWTAWRTVLFKPLKTSYPRGLRFCNHDANLVVALSYVDRVSVLRVEDGEARREAAGARQEAAVGLWNYNSKHLDGRWCSKMEEPMDVQHFHGSKWFVAQGDGFVCLVDGVSCTTLADVSDKDFNGSARALAYSDVLGGVFVIAPNPKPIRFLSTRDTREMATKLTGIRLVWMSCALRAKAFCA